VGRRKSKTNGQEAWTERQDERVETLD
jgi:hypothetical protein